MIIWSSIPFPFQYIAGELQNHIVAVFRTSLPLKNVRLYVGFRFRAYLYSSITTFSTRLEWQIEEPNSPPYSWQGRRRQRGVRAPGGASRHFSLNSLWPSFWAFFFFWVGGKVLRVCSLLFFNPSLSKLRGSLGANIELQAKTWS